MTLATTVNAERIAGELGYSPDLVMQRAREFKIPWTDGPESQWQVGEPLFTIENAIALVDRCRKLDEEHNRRWRDYQAYLAEREAEARRKRDEEMAKTREESRRRYRRLAGEERERKEREAMQAAAEEAAKQAQRDGNPMSFEAFAKRRR
ncbi:MAG TPA: hypothetical protein VGR26_06740 [Acidimicrobiales bacterium]|nr:hypothetical protein [Acidimicrobiales bacterium]